MQFLTVYYYSQHHIKTAFWNRWTLDLAMLEFTSFWTHVFILYSCYSENGTVRTSGGTRVQGSWGARRSKGHVTRALILKVPTSGVHPGGTPVHIPGSNEIRVPRPKGHIKCTKFCVFLGRNLGPCPRSRP